jgi:glycosyltransferase involved in cell wall biosynthesis
MRIAQVAPLATTVRPDHAGSIEGLVWLLTRELAALGHEVTVFGAAGSQVPEPSEFEATMPGPYGQNGSPWTWYAAEWMGLCRAVEQSGRFDVMHAHNYLWSVPLTPLAKCPMVHTTHIFPDEEEASMWRQHPEASITAVSATQWSAYPDLRPAAIVPHGVDVGAHTFRAEPDDYLCWLGRFQPGKGPLEAIEAARSLGLRLLLAGAETDYFHQAVAPRVDGRTVEYVGPVDPVERDALLGGARALLYPILAPEPFGLVLIEAMMSGTPVAAFGLGAVPEIVEEGITGAVAPPGGDLASAVHRCLGLDRAGVYERARSRFGADRMTAQYADLYARVRAGDRSTA